MQWIKVGTNCTEAFPATDSNDYAELKKACKHMTGSTDGLKALFLRHGGLSSTIKFCGSAGSPPAPPPGKLRCPTGKMLDKFNPGKWCSGVACTETECCITPPTCADFTQNGDETGRDCGGSCDACPTCLDQKRNGDEDGKDCGGSCAACPRGASNRTDCHQHTADHDRSAYKSGLKVDGKPATCAMLKPYCCHSTHGAKVQGLCPETCLVCAGPGVCKDQCESGLYLGYYRAPGASTGQWVMYSKPGTGRTAQKCSAVKEYCSHSSHAATLSKRCQKTCGTCPTCSDGVHNGDEGGKDCGGSCPAVCPTCTDNKFNGDEVGWKDKNGTQFGDCGGSCPAVCPTCTDNKFNGDEVGWKDKNGTQFGDCGGSCSACPACSARVRV